MQACCTHAVLRATVRAPSRPARRSALVVRASESALEPWQLAKLQSALAAGRRQVKVEKLCKEVGLPRQTVLQWLKDAPQPDRAQVSLLEARAAAEQAAAERQAVLRQARAPRADAEADSRPAPRGSGGDPGAPAWKRYAKEKKLGRQAEATLEMLYCRTQWPSDEAVSSLWDLHRLPREKVIEWFQQRRRQEQRRRGAGGSTGGGRSKGGGLAGAGAGASAGAGAGAGAAQSGGTEWDANWRQK